MKALLKALAANPITVFAAPTTTRAIPPAAGDIAYVAGWNQDTGAVPEFDVRLRAAGSNALTAAEIFAGILEALVVADDDFTATHGTETFTANSHGLETGDGPIRLTNAGGALPAGVSAGTDYWVIKVDANDFKLATSLENALEGTNLSITGNGTGTHTLSDTASTKRVRWHLLAELGTAGDGAVTLTAANGYTKRLPHSPDVIAYAIAATFGSAVATKALITAVMDR